MRGLHYIYFKAKESYHARCAEYEKMKHENASSKDLDKVEAKYKKASELLQNILSVFLLFIFFPH